MATACGTREGTLSRMQKKHPTHTENIRAPSPNRPRSSASVPPYTSVRSRQKHGVYWAQPFSDNSKSQQNSADS
eukprot:2509625-Pyramimonas_sp.AAC.1